MSSWTGGGCRRRREGQPLLVVGVIAAVLLATSAVAAQGLPGGVTPERGVRLPSPAPDVQPDAISGDDGPWERTSWRHVPGEDVPVGYRVVTTYHGALLGTGSALFGFHWLLSVVLSESDFRIDDGRLARDEGRNAPLIAPLIGPFIALGTEADRPAAEQVLLALDGVAQMGSLAMAMAGLLLPQHWLVKIELHSAGFQYRF